MCVSVCVHLSYPSYSFLLVDIFQELLMCVVVNFQQWNTIACTHLLETITHTHIHKRIALICLIIGCYWYDILIYIHVYVDIGVVTYMCGEKLAEKLDVRVDDRVMWYIRLINYLIVSKGKLHVLNMQIFWIYMVYKYIWRRLILALGLI